LSLDDVHVESLVPENLRGGDAAAFMASLAQVDEAMRQRFDEATHSNHVLRYVAHLDRDGRATVGLTALPRDHAFANIRLTDNIVQFSTKRYSANPLVVQGPGAGPDVTAAGVFSDLLRVVAGLGARV
jgi:aspartokinase/homoserine dehydrogenase 1